MKTKFILFVIALFIFAIPANSQTKQEIDASVKEIKTKYAEVNKNEKRSVLKSWSKEEDMESSGANYYLLNGKIIKITYGVNGGGDCGEGYEFYYDNGKLFFAFYKMECFGGDFLGGSERRCYFKEGKMIKYLNKNLKPKKENEIKQNSQEFKDQEDNILMIEKIVLEDLKLAK
jgi:hypothetical protein